MATNNSANIPTGASGKILQGQGVGVPLALSTAAYPVTSGNNGNVITSNGTNFVSSVLPTGSSTPTQGIQFVSITLTSPQVKDLNATPIQVVAAQGAGTIIVPIYPIVGKLNYGGSDPYSPGDTGNGNVSLYYGTSQLIKAALTTLELTQTSNILDNISTSGATNNVATNVQNLALNLYTVNSPVQGNTADDNTVVVSFSYYVLTI